MSIHLIFENYFLAIIIFVSVIQMSKETLEENKVWIVLRK